MHGKRSLKRDARIVHFHHCYQMNDCGHLELSALPEIRSERIQPTISFFLRITRMLDEPPVPHLIPKSS